MRPHRQHQHRVQILCSGFFLLVVLFFHGATMDTRAGSPEGGAHHARRLPLEDPYFRRHDFFRFSKSPPLRRRRRRERRSRRPRRRLRRPRRRRSSPRPPRRSRDSRPRPPRCSLRPGLPRLQRSPLLDMTLLCIRLRFW